MIRAIYWIFHLIIFENDHFHLFRLLIFLLEAPFIPLRGWPFPKFVITVFLPRLSHVGLTTVEHQADSRARAAFSILLERIKGGNAASEIARMEYGHMLLERRSTARYRAPEAENVT